MRDFLAVLALVALAAGAFGCAGEQFVKKTDLGDVTVIQGGRTGAFGTDNSFVHIQKRADQVDAVIRLEKTYHKESMSWNGCSDDLPNKNARNIRREKVKEKWTEDVPNPAAVPSENFGFGHNPSTGNVLLPAAAEAAGIAATGGIGGGGDIINKAFGGNAEAKSQSDSNANAEINHSGNSSSRGGGHGSGRDRHNDHGGGCNKH